MKISCPACQAKYSIADEKVTDRLAKIRCRKCGATIVIDGKTSPANVYTAAGETPDAGAGGAVEHDSSYSVDFGEGDQRNMTVPEIVAAYNAGQITAETYLWADGFADWKALGEVDEIVEALHAAPQAPAAAAPAFPASPTATPSPWSAPVATASRAAARPVRGASADLFGGIDHAGSEEDVTTSAPERGGGSAHSAPTVGAGASGARNESSVLFSLSALTSASSPTAAARPSSRPISSAASRDDSGLIDLKALTAAATRTEAQVTAPSAAPIMAPPLGLASPLGLGSPLGGGFAASAEPAYAAAGKSKTGLYIGGALVLCALIVGVAIVLKPPPPAPPPPPVAVETPPAPAPTPSPTPVVTAAPPTTGTVEEPAPSAKAPAPVAVHHASGGGAVAPKKPAAASAGGDTPAAPAAPKPAKHSSCGCAPGDLMCNMQCSAK